MQKFSKFLQMLPFLFSLSHSDLGAWCLKKSLSQMLNQLFHFFELHEVGKYYVKHSTGYTYYWYHDSCVSLLKSHVSLWNSLRYLKKSMRHSMKCVIEFNFGDATIGNTWSNFSLVTLPSMIVIHPLCLHSCGVPIFILPH